MQSLDTKSLKPAKRYAQALLKLEGKDFSQNLEDISKLMKENQEFKSFIEHPVINVIEKKQTFKELFENKIDNEIINLMYVLIDNSRLKILPTICDVYKHEFEKKKDIIRATVESAVELTDSEKHDLNHKLNVKFSKNIKIDYSINTDLIAGFIIQIEDNIIDLSLRAKFNKLKKA